MKSSIRLSGIVKAFKGQFKPLLKHINTIVFVIIAGFLIFGVYSVSQILNQPTDLLYLEEQQKTTVRSRFDETTIQKVKALKNRQEDSSLDLPVNQRVNPFRE
jgi:hypothetical protein